MQVDLRDLTRGPIKKQILLFSLPLILSNLLQVLFNMADVAVVGRFAGALALGSVGSTSTLIVLFTGFLIGMGSGVNVIVARFYGANDYHALHRTIHTSALLCAIVGVVIMGLALTFAEGILNLLNTKPELMDGAKLYLRIYCLGMPAVAIYNFGAAVFSAVGDTKKPLYYLMIAGVVNVLLNLFFVIVCHMSVAGVALASIISHYISATLIIVALIRSSNTAFALVPKELSIDDDKAKMILSFGIIAGCQSAIFAIANLFVQSGVNSFDATMVAGNAAASNADGMIFEIMAAFYTACASFIGQNYGAGNRERVKQSFRICLTYSALVGAVLGALAILFGEKFLMIFTTDPLVAKAGMYSLIVKGVAYWISAFMDCSVAASRALGKSVVPSVILIAGSCVFRIIWIYTVFAYFATPASLYLLYCASWTISSIAEVWYFKHIFRKVMPKTA